MHKKGEHMRTTIDIPESVVAEGLKVTHLKTKTALIITAIKELIRRHKLSEIKKFKGKIDLNIDLDVSRGRK